MRKNVIRTGVLCSQPCPDAPDDGWEWLNMIVDGEWRLLRCQRKVELRDGEVALYAIGEAPQIVSTRP